MVIETNEWIPADFNINAATVHILNKDAEAPILTEYALELDEEKYKLIYKKVDKFFKDKELKFAKFGEYRSIIPEILEEFNDDNFVDVSKEVAKVLFSVIKGNETAQSCDLFVVDLITDKGRMLGCIQVDFIVSVEHEILTEGKKIGVNINNNLNSLPSAGKFDKGAFILFGNEEFDLYVVDKFKKTKSEDEYGADYFTNSFLDAQYLEDTRHITKEFKRRTSAFISANITDAEQGEEVRAILRETLENEDTVNIYEFADKITTDDELKEKYCSLVNDISKESELQLDKKYCSEILDKITLRIKNDSSEIKVTLSQDDYKDPNKFEVIKNGDGSINIVLKNIYTFNEK